MTDKDSILARALSTERTYFELGAHVRELPGSTLAWMPGLAGSAAGAVIHRTNPELIISLGESWIEAIGQSLSDVGAKLARIYFDSTTSQLTDLLEKAGFSSRQELVFVASLPEKATEVTLRAVKNNDDWLLKCAFHDKIKETSDGHETASRDWVAIERAKCAFGMETFLAELNGTVIGTVGAIWSDRMLRIKNLLVHPAHRRNWNASSIVLKLAALGRSRGIFEQCALALDKGIGEKLYCSLGMRMIGSQVEWSKPS